jgi:hypothetical protein
MEFPDNNAGYGATAGGAGTQERVRASLERFRPIFLDDLIRVGPGRDGGYVVNERAIRQSKYLMSFGVNDDWTFELDFLNRKPDVQVSCFDPYVSKRGFLVKMLNAWNEILSLRFVLLAASLNLSRVRRRFSELDVSSGIYYGFKRFIARPNVRFYPLGVSNETNTQFVTFSGALQLLGSDEIPANSVFVKMDIERSEFRVIPELLKLEKYINGLVVEFHDLDILWPEFVELMEQIRTYYAITHIHGNNLGSRIPDTDVPLTLEITFLKKSLISDESPVRQDRAYPIPQLDYPNDPLKEDYALVF